MPPDIFLAFDWFGITSNVNAFVGVMILLGAAAGSLAKKLSVAAYGGILVYIHVVLETDLFIYNTLLMAILAVAFLFLAGRITQSYLSGKEAGA